MFVLLTLYVAQIHEVYLHCAECVNNSQKNSVVCSFLKLSESVLDHKYDPL